MIDINNYVVLDGRALAINCINAKNYVGRSCTIDHSYNKYCDLIGQEEVSISHRHS